MSADLSRKTKKMKQIGKIRALRRGARALRRSARALRRSARAPKFVEVQKSGTGRGSCATQSLTTRLSGTEAVYFVGKRTEPTAGVLAWSNPS